MKRFTLSLLICLTLAATCWGQAPQVLGTRPRYDVGRSYGLVWNDDTQKDENLVKLQTRADAGAPVYPWFFPGSISGNLFPWHIGPNTLVLPNDKGGRLWEGLGLSPASGTGNSNGSLLVGWGNGTTFDGVTNRLTTSGASATVTVVGRTVVASDQYNSVEITGGTNFAAGWYGIASVDTGANTWTLDRACTTGSGADGAGYYCPALVRNHGVGHVVRGMLFAGAYWSGDTIHGTIGYHITPADVSGSVPTGKHFFENCTFSSFLTAGILCGRDMAEYGDDSATDWAGRQDNNADLLTTIHCWFNTINSDYPIKNCILARNNQSVVHNHYDLRATNLAGTVFNFDAGGKLTAIGTTISGSYAGEPQRILRLGRRVERNLSPFIIKGFNFDAATRNPQLVVTNWIGEARQAIVEFDGGILNREDTNDDMPLVDIQSSVYLRLSNIMGGGNAASQCPGIWPNSIRLKLGATAADLPHVVISGCVLGVTADPEEVIDEDNCDAGIRVEFYGNCKPHGEPLADGPYTTTGPP
jgi:hypothetical protein